MLRAGSGYAHRLYAKSLSEFGAPLELPSSGGWLLERPIPGTTVADAMGPYPLFSCPNWNGLRDDLNALRPDLVSVVLVADPFGTYDEALLRSCFDLVRPFKKHYLVEFKSGYSFGSSSHRYRARRALRSVTVEICEPSDALLQEWCGLYTHLIRRHSITGIQAFSVESFRWQFAVPGLVLLRALDQSGECVGAQLWYAQGEVGYFHLAAANERGYELSCLYAIYDTAIRHFQGQVRWLDLGGSAGLSAAADGLARFKQGWSNGERDAFLCGRILNAAAYQHLLGSSASHGDYFPAYRYGRTA